MVDPPPHQDAPTHWLPPRQKQQEQRRRQQQQDDGDSGQDGDDEVVVDALCLGTGRFLRSVLVPALVGAGYRPALVQPRGRSFLTYMNEITVSSSSSSPSYEVDTVLENGQIQTDRIPCYGAFSLGTADDKKAFNDWLKGRQNGYVEFFKIKQGCARTMCGSCPLFFTTCINLKLFVYSFIYCLFYCLTLTHTRTHTHINTNKQKDIYYWSRCYRGRIVIEGYECDEELV